MSKTVRVDEEQLRELRNLNPTLKGIKSDAEVVRASLKIIIDIWRGKERDEEF